MIEALKLDKPKIKNAEALVKHAVSCIMNKESQAPLPTRQLRSLDRPSANDLKLTPGDYFSDSLEAGSPNGSLKEDGPYPQDRSPKEDFPPSP